MHQLQEICHEGVRLVAGKEAGVYFGFTERSGGVSKPPFASLNLGGHVGDDPQAVMENRLRALRALGADSYFSRLLVPHQVHGDTVLTVSSSEDKELQRVRALCEQGADAIVCTAPHVPVMLCFADCLPVVLCAPGGFAVVHSGWKGTYARIAGRAACELARAAQVSTNQICAFIGPHILGDEYVVSPELLHTFTLQFDNIKMDEQNLLDLSLAVRQTLVEVGVPPCEILDTRLSTVRAATRFYSYRREQGVCGRHAALAFIA